MTDTPDDMTTLAVQRLLALTGPRHLVAIAGPPGAGKSTLSHRIASELTARGRRAAIVPMDGFHLDNAVLSARGLLARKGAPETFDAAGFAHLIGRVASGEAGVIYPVFDRTRDVSVAGAGVLDADTEFVLIEGNYLLLKDAPWDGLARYWDLSIWADAPLATLEARLTERWLAEGLPLREAKARAHENDMANVAFVRAQSRAADLELHPRV